MRKVGRRQSALRLHPRRRAAAALHRHPARRPGARRRPVRARELSAGRTWRRWRKLSYPELAFAILSRFMDDVPGPASASCERTYTPRGLRQRRHHAAEDARARACTSSACRTGRRSRSRTSRCSCSAACSSRCWRRKTRPSTSSAPPRATPARPPSTRCAARRGIRVFMLSPHGRMSASSARRCTRCRTPNIHNLAVKGVFDDCQDLVKAGERRRGVQGAAPHRRGELDQLGARRGAGGVLLQGLLRRDARRTASRSRSPCRRATSATSTPATSRARMGLPIRRLILASNENDVLDEFFRTGRYRLAQGGAARPPARRWTSPRPRTSSATSSTWSARDGARVKELWRRLDAEGEFDLSLGYCRACADRLRLRAQHARRPPRHHPASLREVRRDDRPAHRRRREGRASSTASRGVPLICLETALPVKFADTHPRGARPRARSGRRSSRASSSCRSAVEVIEPDAEAREALHRGAAQ